MDDYLRCFGDFNAKDKICRKYCALNLRCVIEKDQTVQMEIFEDIMFGNEIPMKMN